MTLEQYYKEFFDRLVKRTTRRVGTKEAAEDVVQNAFERALKYQDTYNTEMPFPNWFNRILNNSLRQYKNEEKGFSHSEFNEEAVGGVACQQYSNKLWQQIQNELDDYEESHQEVLRLYFIHGYKPKDVERIVDLRYRNIETIIQRFKTTIKEKYNTDV